MRLIETFTEIHARVFTTKTYSNVGDVLDLDALKMKLAENVVSASFVPAFFRELLRLEEEQEEVEYESANTRTKTITKKRKNKKRKKRNAPISSYSNVFKKKTTTSVPSCAC